MSKFDNKLAADGSSSTLTSPVKTASRTPDTVTAEGLPAYSRTAKSDLFLLAISNFVGEETFYEKASDRDARFEGLVHQVTQEDPDWMQRFIPWLRFEALMRSVSVVAACEYVKAGGPSGRKVVASALGRADEPAEVLAYWIGRHGRAVPKPIKRGVADAVNKFYWERNALKYDGVGRGMRMGDVLQIVHPSPRDERQDSLFKALLERRYGNEGDLSQLPMLSLNREIAGLGATEARARLLADPELIGKAGMTWESLSGLGAMDKAAWEAMIPTMGYMALLRNLRNFDQAGVSDAVAKQVIAKLTDPDEVAKSRQLPFRFWSAYKNVSNVRWAWALEQALDLCVVNVPEFKGTTYITTDTSGSMRSTYSAKSTITPAEAAALFAAVVAKRNVGRMRLTGFADGIFEHPVDVGESILTIMKKFNARNGSVGYGTNIPVALRGHRGEDRIMIFTDGQTFGSYGRVTSPKGVPTYAWNLGGYAPTPFQSGQGNQHEFGGLTDKAFQMINLLERGKNADWPF